MVTLRRLRRLLYVVTSLNLCVQHVMGELVLLVTLTRHGSRAPNAVIDELCPKNLANRLAYNVPLGQLTENGMKQTYKLGVFLRETYVKTLGFLPPSLGVGSEAGFRSGFVSDAAERCLMSAQAMAQGLYPNGTGPPGFPNQPVPVETNQEEFDSTLAAAHGVCLRLQQADNKAFDESRGAEIVSQHKSLIDVVAEACGASSDSYASADSGKEGLVLGVKDVSDMMNFDEQQGLERLPAITDDVKRGMTALAFQLLQERYYSRPEQVTYWAGDFPVKLMKNFQAASELYLQGKRPTRLYLSYHGHRELLYGLAHFLGWRFDIQGMPTALGTSAIPPATTMLFELHYHNGSAVGEGNATRLRSVDSAAVSSRNSEGHFSVRTFTWTPQYGQQEVFLDKCGSVDTGKGCPLDNLTQIVDGRLDDDGTWEDICHHIPFDIAESMAHKAVYDGSDHERKKDGTHTTGLVQRLSAGSAIAAAVIVVWLAALVIKKKICATQDGEPYESVP